MKLHPKLIASAIVFVIVGMPLISYIYLRQGLTFRIESIATLKQDSTEKELSKAIRDNFDLEESMVNVMVNGKKINGDIGSRFYKKFTGNKSFYMNTFISSNDNPYTEVLKVNHSLIAMNDKQRLSILNYDMILIDTSGDVRQAYVYDEEEFKKFIQHLSVLLPVESSKKITLDR